MSNCSCTTAGTGLLTPTAPTGLRCGTASTPRTEIANTLNWWTDGSRYGVDYPVEDYNRVGFAIALKQITWNPRTQRYDIGRINETALDRAIASSC